MDNLRIYLATYNVGTSNPEQCLQDLLSISGEENEKLPDFFAIGLQEVKSKPHNMFLDTVFNEWWTVALRDVLDQRGYIKLKSIRLQGLLLLVFTLRKHLLYVGEIETGHTRTGFGGMWGNKGAVSIRLSIYGCSICFVNSHLSAHDYQFKERIEDFHNIVKDHEFHAEDTSKIFDHDYVFWLGDLNFRLSVEYEATPEEIERVILEKDLKSLWEQDELKYFMEEGRAFSEFTEKEPDFAPTFKFEVGTNDYDYKRRPAWCDRILYYANSNKYEIDTLEVEQLSYKSHTSYMGSDHKPVSAEYIIKIPTPVSDQDDSDYSEHVVQFDKIERWEKGEEHKAYYTITKDIIATKDDWIGLFEEKFASLDECDTYGYISKCATPIEETGSSFIDRPQKFEVIIPDVPRRCRGNYCLIYFSRSEDKVTSILGISDTFPIVETWVETDND